jgi:subtilisin family serine protease
LKILISVFFVLSITFAAYGQDFYYSNNEKHYLSKAKNWVSVQIRAEDSLKFRSKIIDQKIFSIKEHLIPERGIFWLQWEQSAFNAEELVEFKKELGILRTFHGYYKIDVAGDTMHYIMTDVFNVQFSEEVTIDQIMAINEKHSVEIISEGLENEYMLRLTEASEMSTLDIANIYYTEGLTAWSLPDFHVSISRESLPSSYFRDQWYLHNTGQGGGITGLDINIVPAWDITRGSSDIIVAVVDEGVDPHENFYEGQLIQGYNAADKSNNGLPRKGDFHGQAVAGIIAANHSSTGVMGVAPNVRIMSVRIEGARVSDQAAAFDTAWVRGADIINLSWGWSGYFDNIAQALQRAMTHGRNGKGTVVVKSAGNTYGGEVSFPGNVPGVLTVGAVTSRNQPARYTPKSKRVDIVAPSGDRKDKRVLNILTIDRHEPYGYVSDGRYYQNFDGTSAAAPQVSGVAALILSMNPELTEKQVRDIIVKSATPYGETDWAGAGRLNAYQALYEVYKNTGPSIIRTSGTTFSLGWIPSNAMISWTFSPGYLISPYTGSGASANLDSSMSEGTLTFIINKPGRSPLMISKDIVIGDTVSGIYQSADRE